MSTQYLPGIKEIYEEVREAKYLSYINNQATDLFTHSYMLCHYPNTHNNSSISGEVLLKIIKKEFPILSRIIIAPSYDEKGMKYIEKNMKIIKENKLDSLFPENIKFLIKMQCYVSNFVLEKDAIVTYSDLLISKNCVADGTKVIGSVYFNCENNPELKKVLREKFTDDVLKIYADICKIIHKDIEFDDNTPVVLTPSSVYDFKNNFLVLMERLIREGYSVAEIVNIFKSTFNASNPVAKFPYISNLLVALNLAYIKYLTNLNFQGDINDGTLLLDDICKCFYDSEISSSNTDKHIEEEVPKEDNKEPLPKKKNKDLIKKFIIMTMLQNQKK